MVDHVSLVVQPSVSFTPSAKHVQEDIKSVKNTKTFRKVWEMPYQASLYYIIIAIIVAIFLFCCNY